MPLLTTLPLFFEALVLATVFTFAIGTFFSIPSVWHYLFNPNNFTAKDIYLKAGEYGESAGYPYSFSPFKEPLNAWTSLAYSFAGIVMLTVWLNDYVLQPDDNRLSEDSLFSLLYGVSSVYLGLSSFLFHASHLEVWRKADAGMTTGSLAAPLVLGIWDRVPPPYASAFTMVCLALLLQISLTHGYLSYGSSDILVPSIIVIFYALELLPRYGGVVDVEQYRYWLYSLYAVIVSFLLRLADIRQKVPGTFSIAIRAVFAISLGMSFVFGPTNPILLLGFFSGLVVWKFPSRGHIFWHIGSAFALFIWWYQLRLRPGNAPAWPAGEEVPDRSIITVLFCIVIKNAIRRIFMNLPVSLFPTEAHKDRLMFFLEHLFFFLWGWHTMVTAPEEEKEGSSWLLNPARCWIKPSFPSEEFRFYYLAKVATSVEDVFYLLYTKFATSRDGQSLVLPTMSISSAALSVSATAHDGNSGNNIDTRPSRDVAMEIHHFATALLTISSCWIGHARIGSLVMLLHDVSDLPLDLVRLFGVWKWKTCQIMSYVATLFTWGYWRLWWFPFVVLMSIYNDGKSLMYESKCEIGHCTMQDMPERWPFLFVLSTLLVLHIFWFALLVKKGLVELAPSIADVASLQSSK